MDKKNLVSITTLNLINEQTQNLRKNKTFFYSTDFNSLVVNYKRVTPNALQAMPIS